MLCQDCGEKVATILFTQIVNNTKTVLHLCKDCAAERGFQNPLLSPTFSTSDLLAGMAEEGDAEDMQEAKIECPCCGLIYSEFKEKGRLGCSDCYSAFFDKLQSLLRKIHGSNQHLGKRPAYDGRLELKRDIRRLRGKLKKAIEREEFEKATELRDKILELERRSRTT